MITRRWRGWTTTPGDADAYVRHFEGSVRAQLDALDGFLGASLERVPDGNGSLATCRASLWAEVDRVAQGLATVMRSDDPSSWLGPVDRIEFFPGQISNTIHPVLRPTFQQVLELSHRGT